MGMKTLDQIAIEQQTDMATVFTRTYAKPHGYTLHLEKFFEPLRLKPIKFLEIGVGGGESIRTWLEYFPNAQVYGVDVVQNTNEWNTPKAPTHERYTFVQGPQQSETFWACFIADQFADWDIIVDDGGHYADGVVTTFRCLWPHLKRNGLYCIEDLGVDAPGSGFRCAGFPNHMDFIKEKLDFVNQGAGIDSLYFSRELAIIRKG